MILTHFETHVAPGVTPSFSRSSTLVHIEHFSTVTRWIALKHESKKKKLKSEGLSVEKEFGSLTA